MKSVSIVSVALGALALMLTHSTPLAAREPDGVAVHATAPTVLDPAKAYLLYRASTAKSGMFAITHVMGRIPSDDEMVAFLAARQQAYEKELPNLRKKAKNGPVPTVENFGFSYDGPSNAFALPVKDFAEDGEMRTYLVEVPPGTYVFYGTAVGTRALTNCNCLGTVKFAAQPGVVTFLGSLYADKVHKPSPVPNLEDNLGEQMFQYSFILGAAVVPADLDTVVPQVAAGLPLARAEYHAVGPFLQPGASWINRLAPVPGVLSYSEGKVVDVRTGKVLE
ncbi:hypothetical protein GCM10011349_11400 [Novosphingobium indicum]|uniref:Uncharacterized protein n=1 Tax=Novosphingobium indicum TaxID=462949 RepID=A0ABQ2JDL7_9SPHN|nr:hypothetical protein [Novosphingobium indicum]GGN45396.1 hypothetical protein GCM10011349_11400 [Novosphingobium indicum]